MLTLFACTCLLMAVAAAGDPAGDNHEFYSYSVTNANGRDVLLGTFRGKVLLIVNVASECGFTDQHYSELVKLQEKYGPTGRFKVLAFPCNQFGQQEPKEIDEIVRHVTRTYNINFPIFQKIDVAGSNAAGVYKHLQDQSGLVPTWNFWKYLIDQHGYVIGAWGPQTRPADLESQIVLALDIAKEQDRANHKQAQPEL